MSPRANQRSRTRTALLDAAVELVREGRPPSMPEAAARALVSNATAYRYFSSAEDLWREASQVAADIAPMFDRTAARMVEAGDDPQARLDAAVREVGWRMVDHQLPFRQLAKAALEQWFRQADLPAEEQAPVRERRRVRVTSQVVEPLADRLPADDLHRLEAALGIVLGTDSMLALIDGVGLEPEDAKAVMLDAGRWLLAGALAELIPEEG